MCLEAQDGTAVLGYCGLGRTASGVEPSRWMSNTLRGRTGGLEDLLGILGVAAAREIPPHLIGVASGSTQLHAIIAPAFIHDRAHIFSVALLVERESVTTIKVRRAFMRHVRPEVDAPQRMLVGGTGEPAFRSNVDEIRALFDLANRHDEQRVTTEAVAGAFAHLNHLTHLQTTDGTVGDRCTVVWRHAKNGRHGGGGGHRNYSGTEPDPNTPTIPTIANGFDVQAIVDVIFEQSVAPDLSLREFDLDGLNEVLGHLREDPDERLQ
jgi:hypothetical protein